ncbi:hypothetical protein [Amycolatopsis methanolica]|uniref:Secreted protein n=1 Tax=Amycolatopsis methanolica 239 TaxID=1068978 RepID=A0A076MR45_AMYME|nr:hypothetical protein [Amycolatopsis methanolica]AIJ23358.1 hypothetical protein AMETH_3266 [Amycolatopsis methanolica 239]
MDARVRSAGLALGAAALLLASACGGNSGSSGSPPATTSAAAGTTASATPTSRPECAALVSTGQALVDTVTQFVNGQATGQQVRVAVQELSASVEVVRTVVGADTAARLDEAKAALGRLQSALTAQPPDLPQVRAAANDTLAVLRDAATLCQASTPSG